MHCPPAVSRPWLWLFGPALLAGLALFSLRAAVSQAAPPAAPPAPAAFIPSVLKALSNGSGYAIADLNDDGALDVVGSSSAASFNLVVLLNTGSGNFSQPITIPGGLVFAGSNVVAVGDLNGDGWVDLVRGNSFEPLWVYFNDGSGRFAGVPTASVGSLQPTSSLALGDLNGDGALDIVQGNTGQASQVYFNDGLGHFTLAGGFGAAVNAVRLGLADLNQDGWLDIVQGNAGLGQYNAVFLNDGAGGFPAATQFGPAGTPGFDIGDLNRDGLLDLALNADDGVQLLYNDGRGDFSAVIPVTVGPTGDRNDLALADLNGDGILDIVRARSHPSIPTPSQVYFGDGAGGYPLTATLSGPNSAAGEFSHLALADLNGDGTFDILHGKSGVPSLAYFTQPGAAFSEGAPLGSLADARALALGDVNGDGALDIALAYLGSQQSSPVFLNDGRGNFSNSQIIAPALWGGQGEVVLGDLNGDGALDAIVGGNASGTQVVLNANDGSGQFNYFGAGSIVCNTCRPDMGYALGDLNGDGALDLVRSLDEVWLNNGHGVFSGLNYLSNLAESWAVGDLNGDGAQDIVSGDGLLFLGDGSGSFPRQSMLEFGTAGAPASVALGDLNGDGALDIVQANHFEPSAIYFNDGSGRAFREVLLGDGHDTRDVAVGDLNGDGALDVVQGNYLEPSRIYFNSGTGDFDRGVEFGQAQPTASVAVGDLNGDGLPDIVQANGLQDGVQTDGTFGNQSYIYFNQLFASPRRPDNSPALLLAQPGHGPAANFLASTEVLSQPVIPISYTLSDPEGDRVGLNAFYSPDGGGRWLPAVAAQGTLTSGLTPRREYPASYLTPTLAIPDLGQAQAQVVVNAAPFNLTGVKVWATFSHTYAADLRLVLQAPNGLTVTLVQAGQLLTGSLPASTILFDDLASTAIVSASAPYRGAYRPAQPLRALLGSPGAGQWRLQLTDTSAQDAGQLLAWGVRVQDEAGAYVYNWDTSASGFFGQSDRVVFRLETTAGLDGRPHAAAVTFPFRVRGTQVRVLSGTTPIRNALVYRLPAGQILGGALLSDRAGQPFTTGPDGFLRGRGQIGLGDRLVALAPISATDTQRVYQTNAAPNAAGLSAFTVSASGVQQITVSPAQQLVLFDLKVSLEWDARNDPAFISRLTFDLGRASDFLFDWTNGQVALGRVTVYQDKGHWNDAQVRLYATNNLRPNADIGGIVSQAISETNVIAGQPHTVSYLPGQVRMAAAWNRFGDSTANNGDWSRALAHELGHYLLFLDDAYLGLDDAGRLIPLTSCAGTAMADPYRDDYSEFKFASGWTGGCLQTLAARSTGRAEWDTLTRFYPGLTAVTNAGPSARPLEFTQVSIIDPGTPNTSLDTPAFSLVLTDGARLAPGDQARLILYQAGASDPAASLVDMGRPRLDQALARGARPGDRLCLYDPAAERLGCRTLTGGESELVVSAKPGWNPEVLVTPVNSRTINLNVSNLAAALPLRARLYPADGGASPAITLAQAGGAYTGQFSLADPAISAHIQIWVEEPEPRRESLTDYALGGNPAPPRRRPRPGGAPTTSSDGQVTLFGDLDFPLGEFYALQTVSRLPPAPAWATVVGQGYRLIKSAGAPAVGAASLNFNYLGELAPPGEENFLKVYYHDGTAWRVLTTTVEPTHNLAVAPVAGVGLYVLMSSYEIPLAGPGWNNFAYPVQAVRPVSEALRSIAGNYALVYGYAPTASLFSRWQLFAPGLPVEVNTLANLSFGQGYWINITNTAILYLKGTGLVSGAALGLEPPAAYAGPLPASAGFTPQAGLAVTARVGGQLCGQGQTMAVNGAIWYRAIVLADGELSGCGAAGQNVTLSVAGLVPTLTAAWQNGPPQVTAFQQTWRLFWPFLQR